MGIALAAISIAVLIQAYIVKPYRIPSASMESALMTGDRVLVDRISWRFCEPRRYDIVVFRPPLTGPAFVKRIVGLPGDTLSLRDGELYVNGRRAPLSHVHRAHGMPAPTQAVSNGRPWSLQLPYTVPAGSYFVMGDNRSSSEDSRDFGPVSRNQLVGRVWVRYWPISRIGAAE